MDMDAFDASAAIVWKKDYGNTVSVLYSDGVRATLGKTRFTLESKYGRIKAGYRVFVVDKKKASMARNISVIEVDAKVELHCDHCGKHFQRSASVIRSNKRKGIKKAYCSSRCSGLASSISKGKTVCICENCGKPFERSTAYLKWAKKHRNNKRVFCSRRCYERHRHKESGWFTAPCLNCKKKINKKINNCSGKIKHHFCNRDCYIAWKKKETHVTLICCWCEKMFERRRTVFLEALKKGHRLTFCTVRCNHKYKARHTKGKTTKKG